MTSAGTGTEPAPEGRPASRAVTIARVMIGLLLALVVVLMGLFVWQGQREARMAVEARAVGAAYTASAYVRWLIEANRQALRRVAESVESRPHLLKAPTIQDLDDGVAALPGSVFIWVFDDQGRSVLTNEPAISPINIAKRDYFLALKDGAEWHIGALLIGERTGRKAFPIGRRIVRDGQFLGAAIIYVPADLLAQFWASMNLGPGSTVGLLRDDGWLVARYPVPAAPLNLSDYVLFTRYLPSAPEGVYQAAASPADGVARIVGYQRIEGLPLVTVVGIPESTLVNSIGHRLGEFALIAAPIGLALLLISVWTVRLLRQEERTRQALADALDRNRILFREIHHRVKNNLQTVAALVRLQPGPAEAQEELIRRIAAMTSVHEHIYGSDQFDRIDMADYIRTLIARLREGYGSTADVECSLAPVVVNTDQALPLGLIVNEVVSNAFKHAFPGGRAGLITVTLEATKAGQASLQVRDNGIGYQPGKATGMGSRLIRGLTQQIGGSYEFRNENGTLFVLTFPLMNAAKGAEGRVQAPGTT
jgi:two-component sensor histidine kinase